MSATIDHPHRHAISAREGDPLVLSVLDDLLLQRGEFHPLEFLMAMGFLDEDDYRDLQEGRRRDLVSALLCDVEEVVEALQQARTYLLKQGLVARAAPIEAVAAVADSRAASQAKLIELCSSILAPAGMQKDLFQDSAANIAEHEVIEALAAHRFEAAREALSTLVEVAGPSGAANYYRMLLEKAESTDWTAETRLTELEETIAPLATRSLGIRASRYLAPLWQSLARRLSRAPFSPEKPKLHASYANARAGRWERVVEVIEKESEWQRHPELMIRVAEAYQRLSKTSEARRAWSRLCWSHPQIAENVLSRRCDPVLTKYWREFSGVEPELPGEDFPSWLLLADPRQRHHVPADLAPEGSLGAAYAAIHRLLANPQDVSARRVVNDHNQALLKLCLAQFAKR